MLRRARVPLAIALAASTLIGAASSGRADGERPWPEEWPIVLPPARGPFSVELPRPPEPATPAAARVLEVLDRIRSNVRDTRYQHHLVVSERRGIYRFDCSLMVDWVLDRASPRATRHLASTARPLAEHFVRTIERAPTDRFAAGWRRLEDIREVRAGDVFAWRRPPGFPSRNTGHTGFALEAPRRVLGLPNGYAIRVADATGSAHENDTRPFPGVGGFGMGTLVFLTDGEGHGTHYGWFGTRSGGYVVTPIVFGRVGP